MNKIKVGAKIKVNAENPTTAHTLVRCKHADDSTRGTKKNEHLGQRGKTCKAVRAGCK